MFDPYQPAEGIHVLPSYFPLPGLGMVPVNAFVLEAAEPVLVDTGLLPLSDEFVEKLSAAIDPMRLKWLWLTHADQDHVGSIHRLLDQVPDLRVITTYLGLGRMSLFRPLPMDRVYLLNPGQSITVGDRSLLAMKPPSFDSPETTGFYDAGSGVLFCSDCFGALMSEPAEYAGDMEAAKLREGSTTWATLDAPWLHVVDRGLFARSLDLVRKLAPQLVLSSHLPPARGMTEDLLQLLAAVPDADPFVGFDQQALQAMLSQMA